MRGRKLDAGEWPLWLRTQFIVILLVCVTTIISAEEEGSVMQGAKLGTWGVDLSNIDPTVDAGDDFFQYVNGKWLDSYELPPEKTSSGSFYVLRDEAEEAVKALVLEVSSKENAPGTPGQKVADYYASFLDVDAVNAAGLAPIQDELDRIAAISSKEELPRHWGASVIYGGQAPIGLGISLDRMDPDRYLLFVAASGLGLPDRDYYLGESEQMQEMQAAYVANIQKVLGLVDYEDRAELAPRILELETALATQHWTRAERRDRDKTYNVHTIDSLHAEFKGFAWREMLDGVGVTDIEELNVLHPSAIAGIIQVIDETDLAVWKAYLTYHLLVNESFYLHDELDDAVFEFHQKELSGQMEKRERWRRAVSLLGSTTGLGWEVGKLYVEKHFPPIKKELMDDLIENVRATFKDRLEALAWMGPETRKRALEKLASFHPKIGYPESPPSLDDLDIVPDDLAANVWALRKFWHDYEIERLPKPSDRTEWGMTPQTVNAYYNTSFNEIVFPAAILQAPFFDDRADPAVNYGAIGVVIAHEMGHGFDDQGSKSDAKGIQRNWWTDEDRENFTELTSVLVDQFNGYEVLPDVFVDGEFTLGENIGDLGGVGIAYAAYLRSLNGEEAPVIDGLTGTQRFFLSYAQIWRYKAREETTLNRVKSDPHSPPKFRVNGIVRNADAWYEAFEVTEDDDLYLPKEERVIIW